MNYQPPVGREDEEHPMTQTYSTTVDDQPKSNRTRAIIIGIVVVLIVAVVGGWFFLSAANDSPAEAGPADQAPEITVVQPGSGTIEGTINASGTIAARRALPVGVVGEGGRVVSVNVEQGQWVRAGQVLASIDRSVQNQQARAQAAQVQVARADAELAQNNLDRALQLVERGFVSTADVDRLTATRDAARARVNVAQAQLAELRERNARLNIVAPASGLVLERNIEPGQTVSAGIASAFVIAQGGEMELRAQVGESDLQKLSVGVPAEVTPVGSSETYSGQIWQIEPTVDAQSRQGTARIALKYEPGLRPGGFASVTIRSGTTVAPLLPESAVLADDNGTYVYIVDKANTVQRRPIETGMVTPNGIAVTDGLTGDERIVVSAGGFLNPGERVNPVVRKK
ncbi:MAG: efflux transporter periplasmic adaptor subunit [Citromicrobium sp.]|nr:efflux transporter periplasmic adaptor subunit [Citromicrobium sp.]MAS84558.1 efflux transporter periplasmic adaptor subunit [Erythrobacteraceae bacterium]MBD75651.1 efflux transporter periplasmic adaptor subunit [Citromicrobium sp.]MBT45761.1 efflux transporter periplasmic adaptor subunit [Citromicrobium sp.]|tara:strand:+ start:499 stop:1695 length:1197 start_codon:yes stop_codon:yes gene_type:complete